MQLIDYISTVVKRNNRLMVDRSMDVFVIGRAIFPADGKDRYLKILHQRRGNIILRAQRIGCAENGIRTAGFQRNGKIRCFSSY